MQPDVLKAELDSRMIGAEARHAATIDAIKKEAGEEVVSDLRSSSNGVPKQNWTSPLLQHFDVLARPLVQTKAKAVAAAHPTAAAAAAPAAEGKGE